MVFLLKIILAHILGDFVLQLDSWVKNKEKYKIKSVYLYAHVAVHFILLTAFLQFQYIKYVVPVIIITISHYLFDVLKLYLQQKKTKRIWFFIDQLLHITVLIGIAFYVKEIKISFNHLFSSKMLLLSIALLTVTKVSSVVIKTIILQWKPENNDKKDQSLAKAGNYIGILERLFVFTFIVLNHWQAIGFLLAAKSVFRFGDLTKSSERKLTEYILIGTLLSFGIAILIGIIYLKLTKFYNL
jgi:hypothetical protein